MNLLQKKKTTTHKYVFKNKKNPLIHQQILDRINIFSAVLLSGQSTTLNKCSKSGKLKKLFVSTRQKLHSITIPVVVVHSLKKKNKNTKIHSFNSSLTK